MIIAFLPATASSQITSTLKGSKSVLLIN